MAQTAVAGVVAAGRVPTWIIPAASIATDPTSGAYTIPLTALTGATTVKTDCHMDAGDISVSRSAQTRERQRLCQIVAETIKTGETIDVEVAGVYDQQALTTALVNKMYAAVPEGAAVYIAQAFGWDSNATPTTATKIDLYKGTVQTRTKNQPTSLDEDLKFTAVISASAYWPDLSLT